MFLGSILISLNINIYARFREGIGNGGWLRHTEVLTAPQQTGVMLPATVHSHTHLHTPLLHTSGFTLLSWYVLIYRDVFLCPLVKLATLLHVCWFKLL